MKFAMVAAAVAVACFQGASAGAVTLTLDTTNDSSFIGMAGTSHEAKFQFGGCPEYDGYFCATSLDLTLGVPLTVFTSGVSFTEVPIYDPSFNGDTFNIASFDFDTLFDVQGHSFTITQHATFNQIANDQFQFTVFQSSPVLVDLGAYGTLQATSDYRAGQMRSGPGGGGMALSTTFVLLTPSVPEPTTWTMMIAGFGLIGGSLRARRRMPFSLLKVSFAS